jgi:hypothetical protein
MSTFNWKSVLRTVAMKMIGILLALVLIPLALFFLAYPFVCLATTQGGDDAKVAVVSDHLNKIKTGYRIGGLFTVATQKSGKKEAHSKGSLNENVYCFYPVWPDQLQPSKGDAIRVWPAKKPLLGAPATEGWGWFLAGTVFVLGLVMVEFIFLAVSLH